MAVAEAKTLNFSRKKFSPELIMRQAATALAFKTATGWKFEDRWLKSLGKMSKVAARP